MDDENLMAYKGYTANAVYSAEDRVFYGKVLGISDLVDFQSESAKDLENEFHKAVDDYLAFCAEIGKQPQEQCKMRAWAAFNSMREKAAKNGYMDDADIEAEISAARMEKAASVPENER